MVLSQVNLVIRHNLALSRHQANLLSPGSLVSFINWANLFNLDNLFSQANLFNQGNLHNQVNLFNQDNLFSQANLFNQGNLHSEVNLFNQDNLHIQLTLLNNRSILCHILTRLCAQLIRLIRPTYQQSARPQGGYYLQGHSRPVYNLPQGSSYYLQ